MTRFADDAVTAFDSDKKPRGKWRWLTIILGCIFGLGLLTAIYSYDPLDLEVNRIGWLRAGEGHAVEILNVGSGPTTVQQIQVNGRADCMVSRSMMVGDEFKPINLRVGEKLSLISTFRIVRATIRTNMGQTPTTSVGVIARDGMRRPVKIWNNSGDLSQFCLPLELGQHHQGVGP